MISGVITAIGAAITLGILTFLGKGVVKYNSLRSPRFIPMSINPYSPMKLMIKFSRKECIRRVLGGEEPSAGEDWQLRILYAYDVPSGESFHFDTNQAAREWVSAYKQRFKDIYGYDYDEVPGHVVKYW